jgi:hypothetical protein
MTTSMVRDLPPHLPLFNIPKLEVSEELTPVTNPVYEDKVPEKLHLSLCQLENLPGLFTLRFEPSTLPDCAQPSPSPITSSLRLFGTYGLL